MFRIALVWNPTKAMLSPNCHLLESGLGSLGKRRGNAPCKEGAAPLGMPCAPEGSCCQRSRPVLEGCSRFFSHCRWLDRNSRGKRLCLFPRSPQPIPKQKGPGFPLLLRLFL